jgi:HEAT repeat protein
MEPEPAIQVVDAALFEKWMQDFSSPDAFLREEAEGILRRVCFLGPPHGVSGPGSHLRFEEEGRERLRTSIIVEPLRRWLNNGTVRERIFAAQALAEMCDMQSVDALFGLLAHPDVQLRRVVAGELWRFKDARLVEPLIAALKDSDQEVRRSAAKALCWQKDVRAFDCFLALITSSPDDELRATATHGLSDLGDPRALPVMLAEMKSKIWKQRQRAVWVIGSIRSPAALEALRAALHDPKPQVRRAAKHGLSNWEFHIWNRADADYWKRNKPPSSFVGVP